MSDQPLTEKQLANLLDVLNNWRWPKEFGQFQNYGDGRDFIRGAYRAVTFIRRCIKDMKPPKRGRKKKVIA
jgi:hypothetical protein